MNKHSFLRTLVFAIVILAGTGFFLVKDFGLGQRSKEIPYTGETIVIEKKMEDEFNTEIINLVKEYDGATVDKDAVSIPYYSRRLIVQGKSDKLELTRYGAKVVVCGPYDLYVMQFTTREATEAAYNELQGAEDIEYCESDGYAECMTDSGDYEAMSWGAEVIGANTYAKYVQTQTEDNIVVAVVDTGVYKHSFLKDRILDEGMNFIDNDINPDDEKGHGTHVAGTIVDCTPGLNVMILPVKVLDENGMGSWLITSLGIRYAVNRGAQIINLSLGNEKGTKGINKTVDNAVLYAINRGCTVVVAAGNDNWDMMDCSIAHLDRCIVVSAVDTNLQKADFSSWGDSVDVAAPGVNIMSCIPKRIGGFTIGGTKKENSGTSMATPHISALAAMIKLEHPSFTPEEVENELISHCVDLGDEGKDPYYGWGIPDFGKVRTEREPQQSESNQNEIDSVYDAILAEYKMLSKNHFERSFWEEAKYANEGVCNFSMGPYSVYYKVIDLADDGIPELLISINEDGESKNIVDIFGIKDGEPVGLIESNESVGYRSRYYVCADNRVKNVGSDGALDLEISYYRLAADSAVLELEEQYIYDGWNGDQYTRINNNGDAVSISKAEYELVSSERDVRTDSDWKLLNGENEDNTEKNTDDEENSTPVKAYQGIFMKGNTFISIQLYTGQAPGEAIGIVYCVTWPEWNEDGYIVSDIIEQVGEVYEITAGRKYEIYSEGNVYDLTYYDGKVVLDGNTPYAGSYVQVSNCGADMEKSELWLKFPDTGKEKSAVQYRDDASEYILPDSDSAEITTEQLEDLSAEQLRLARNEIYARHGRCFDSPELQEYFDSKPWYVPRYTPEEFDEIQTNVFNEIELKNLRLILMAEER